MGDARTLLFSLGVLAGGTLVGILICLMLFAFFGRLLRNSKSTLRLLLLKQTRSQARYLIPLLALIIALPTTALPDRIKERLEHFFTLYVIGVPGS